MTGKQRAYLISLASRENTILYIGKNGITPEVTSSADEALEARELVKIGIQQNCAEDPNDLAQTLAERTKSSVILVIGRKMVLYREGKGKKKKITLPDARKKG